MVGCLGVCALTWNIINTFTVLSLVSSDHVDGLLEQVEVKVLIGKRRREVKVPIYKGLASGIKKGVNVTLIPSSLFYGLELAVKVI